MTIVLVLIALVVQSVVSFMFFLYCDENVRPGTSRELVCHAADDGGYLATVLLPPVTVMVAGVVAFRRRRTGAVVWVFALAMLVGIAVPLMTTVVAG